MQLTCNCIKSIYNNTKGVDFEIILVDNNSTKDNADDFSKLFPGITLIKSKENGGFAKGNNLGIQQSKGSLILLLNSDTLLTDDSISKAAAALTNNANIGVLSVRLVYEDDSYQHNARKFRSIRNELLDIIRPFLQLMPYRKRALLMMNQYFNGDFDTYCDWVSGAFILFRRELVEQLPGKKLDERFFMYGEDQLWCYQLQQLGYKVYFLAITSVIHIANASTEPEKQLKLLKILLKREMQIMAIRKGRSLYYYIFCFLFTGKEMGRYYIKTVANKVFKYQIR